MTMFINVKNSAHRGVVRVLGGGYRTLYRRTDTVERDRPPLVEGFLEVENITPVIYESLDQHDQGSGLVMTKEEWVDEFSQLNALQNIISRGRGSPIPMGKLVLVEGRNDVVFKTTTEICIPFAWREFYREVEGTLSRRLVEEQTMDDLVDWLVTNSYLESFQAIRFTPKEPRHTVFV